MRCNIVETKIVLKGIRPELGREIGTSKHCADGIRDGLMRTFNRAILMGCSRTSKINLIASLEKEISNGGTAPEVSTRIKTDILSRDITFTTMEKKPAVEKVNRWCLGGEAFAKETTSEVVSDEAVTGLTMESLKATKARGILGALDHKTKVNTDALTTHGSAAGRIQTAREVAKFSACANRTVLKIVSKRYIGNTIGVGVHLGNTPRMGMAKTLMPEDTKLIARNVMESEAVTWSEMMWGVEEGR